MSYSNGKKVIAYVPAILQQLHDNEDTFYQYSEWCKAMFV